MAHVTSPQDGKAEEKQSTPWRVKFTCGKKNPSYQEIRKDLLTACWGNEKMAHVLYHLLCAASWKAFNSHMDESTRKVVLQEKHADIIKCLASDKLKFKVKISEPTLITYLKIFAQVGYVCKYGHKGAQEIDFDAVETAFVNPPEKPVIEKNLSSNLSLNQTPSNEVVELRQEVAYLRETQALMREQMQDLSLTLVGFKSLHAQIEHEFKLNFSLLTKAFNIKNSDESAQEAGSEALFSSKIDSLDREEDRRDKNIVPAAFAEGQDGGSTIVSPHYLRLLDLDCLAEDMAEAQPCSYSQDFQATHVSEVKQEENVPPPAIGYKQNTPDPEHKEPDKPASTEKGKGGKRKVKAEQIPMIQVGPPEMPPDDAEWKPGTIAKLFNHWRGHEPLTQGAAVQQNTAAGALYRAGYTREQIIRVRNHMCEQQYWIDQGGVEIWNVANNIAKVWKQIANVVPFQPKPPQSTGQTPGQLTTAALRAKAQKFGTLPTKERIAK